MRLRILACQAILLSCSGCAVGAAGIAGDLLAGASVVSMTVTGKGLGDQAVSAASGKDCRLVEGMVRHDRGICEDYKTAGARRPYLVELPPPEMPTVLIGQPMQAQPAALTMAVASNRPPTPTPVLPPAGMAQPILAAAQQEMPRVAGTDGAAAAEKMATEDKSDAAAAEEETAAAKPAKPPEPPAIVMESEDSMKLAFGSGRSDKEVMAQLHAAIAAWRETDKPPPPPDQAAPAAAAQAAEPAKPGEEAKTAEPAKAGEETKTAEPAKPAEETKTAEPVTAAAEPTRAATEAKPAGEPGPTATKPSES